MKILFASNNKHKCFEMSELFKEYGKPDIELVFPFKLTDENLDVIEDGKNYKENALIKAKAFFEKFKIPCFSDDSGLEVFSINSEPGICSARYSGNSATDKSNRDKLLANLRNVTDKSARFVCTICYFDGNDSYFFDGFVNGKIIDNEIGNNGFGYDPIFIPDGYSLTFAEVDDNEKNKISHRSIAVREFLNFLINNNE